MKRNKETYTTAKKVSAVFMMLALLWLTISIPFVFSSQQKIAQQDKMADCSSPLTGNDEGSTNPFGNNTEEKVPGSSNSFSEEYIHDHHFTDFFSAILLQYYISKNADTYHAYHGEQLVPPPDIA